jgi:hypothetical protein
MGILSTIFDKLGIGKKKVAAEPKAAPKSAPVGTPKPAVGTPKPVADGRTMAPAGYIPPSGPTAAPAKPAPVEMVDVVTKLDKMAAGKNLDWKVSIVDLLKVLGIDSSLQNRKELATELGCPKELMGGDYSQMNMWLHKAVLKAIAENGGNIPHELTD